MDLEYSANQLKQEGNRAYKSGNYAQALTHYNNAIQKNPKESAFYLNKALCYFQIKRFQDCINQCNKAIELNPQYVKAMKKKATAFVQQLKFDDALTSLKQANSIEKTQATSNEIDEVEHYVSNYNRYKEALTRDDYQEALSCVSYLVNKIPQNDELKLIKIQCLAKTGATEQASQALRTLSNHQSPEMFYLKGIIELYSGDSAKAKNYFSEGIRLDPQNAKCQKALNKAKKCQKFKEQGNQFLKANNWQSAEAKYTQALNLDPYNKKLNAIIYSNRALTFMKRKMWVKAAQDLNKSIQMNPKYLKSYVKRAQVNMEREEYSAAISDYAKIQQLDPSINMQAKIQAAKKKQKQAKKKDYYAILGISKNATDEQIKKAYKKMALKYHPDRNRNKSQVEQQEASKKFKDICEAQDVLTNPEKKKMYDSGQMQFDGDTGAGFEGFSSNMGDMGGFSGFGGMGGNGNVKFTMNGSNMGNIDPSQIFSMFMGGPFAGKRGKSTQKGASQKGKFSGMGGMGGFDGFGFDDFGGFSSFGNFGQKTRTK